MPGAPTSSDASRVRPRSLTLSVSLPDLVPQQPRMFRSTFPRGTLTVNSMLSSSIWRVNRPSRTKAMKMGLPHSTPRVPQPMVMVLTFSPLLVVSRMPFPMELTISLA